VANLHVAPLAGHREDTMKKNTTTKKNEGEGGKGDSKKVAKKDAKKQDLNKKVTKKGCKMDAMPWKKTKQTTKKAAKAKAAAEGAAKANKNAKAAAKANKKPPPPAPTELQKGISMWTKGKCQPKPAGQPRGPRRTMLMVLLWRKKTASPAHAKTKTWKR